MILASCKTHNHGDSRLSADDFNSKSFYMNDFESYSSGKSITTDEAKVEVRVKGFGPVVQSAGPKNSTRYVTGTDTNDKPAGIMSFVPMSSKLEISFRMRASGSNSRRDSFGIYSNDKPIFMLTNVNNDLRNGPEVYVSGIALDDWADIKIVTDPALAQDNIEVFVDGVSKRKGTILDLRDTPINSIRFGSLMSIDDLVLGGEQGAYEASKTSFEKAFETAKSTYNEATPKVAALQTRSQDEKLKQVAFQWALDQDKQLIESGFKNFDKTLLIAAESISHDIVNFANDAKISQKNSEPANLFPNITDDCPYKDDIFNIETYGTIVPSSIPDLKSDVVLRFAYSFLHPKSPNHGNPLILESLLTLIFSKNVYEYDSFSTSAVQAYILINKVYPNLILPGAKTKINASLRDWAKSELDLIKAKAASEDYVKDSWLNGEINPILSVGYKGLALNDPSMLDTANSAILNVYKTLLPDGATNYAGYATETPTYHFVAIDAMAWYWLFTGNKTAYDFVYNSLGYWPLNNNPGISEYYTASSWKYYWNKMPAGSRTVASLTKDSYNYQLAPVTSDLLASLLWKTGIPALKARPDNYTLYDRNIIGPRAKYGNVNYALFTRDSGYNVYSKSILTSSMGRGLGSFFGMAVLNDAEGWNLNAAAQEFMGVITKGSEKYFLATDIKSSVSMTKTVQGLSTRYSLTTRIKPLSGFDNTQQWVTSRDRAIGMISITSTQDNQASSINAVANFVSGRANWGQEKAFQKIDSNTYQYGKLKIRVIQHNFGRYDISYGNTYVYEAEKAKDTKKGTFTFKDPLSQDNEGTLHTYKAGTHYYYLVEIIPEGSSFSTVKKLDLADGLLGFESNDGNKKLIMIHNPTEAPIKLTHSNAPGYSQYSIQLGTNGKIDRDKYGNMTNFQSMAKTSSENASFASSENFAYTIPPDRHILHVASNNPDDHTAGFYFYDDVFNR